jgi:hypothetical protein
MQLPAANVLPFLVIIPLIVWRMYSRVRRNVGRQPLSKIRPYITIGMFPLLVVLLGWGALRRPELATVLLAALAGGAAGGALLGYNGLRHTNCEGTPQGLFYTPNAHIGIALSLLFVGRVIYRMVFLYSQNPYAAQTPQDFSASPLTLGIFGLLAGYYVAYAVGLVRWRLRVEGAPRTSP